MFGLANARSRRRRITHNRGGARAGSVHSSAGQFFSFSINRLFFSFLSSPPNERKEERESCEIQVVHHQTTTNQLRWATSPNQPRQKHIIRRMPTHGSALRSSTVINVNQPHSIGIRLVRASAPCKPSAADQQGAVVCRATLSRLQTPYPPLHHVNDPVKPQVAVRKQLRR